jgi:GNAT superfamily N-acetyltransferase
MSEWHRGDFVISTDKARLDRALVRRFLSGSYWASGIPREIVDRSIDNSLCFGVYEGTEQVGFARVITDFATFAYIGDVFIVETRRGEGLGVWLMKVIMAYPDLRNLRRWMLVTRDAHGLYRKLGFTELAHPERVMEIVVPDVYGRSRESRVESQESDGD